MARGARAGRRGRAGPGRRGGRLPGGDQAHERRGAAHQGARLRLAWLRLRLRLRERPALHVRRHRGHARCAALALVRPRGLLRVGSGRPDQQPGVGLLLPAREGRGHRRAPDPAALPAGPLAQSARRDPRLRGGLQRLPAPHRPRPAAGPALPRRALGAADHHARHVPARAPAERARLVGQLHTGARGGPAAGGRERGRRAPAAVRRPAAGRAQLRPGARRARQARLERLRVRAFHDSEPQGAPARQPALPLGGRRSLVRGPPHRPRQAERDRRGPPGHPGGQHRLQPQRGVVAHRLHRAPLHALRAEARAREAHDLRARRQAHPHARAQGERARGGRGRAPAHLLRDALGPRVLAAERHAHLDGRGGLRVGRRELGPLPDHEPVGGLRRGRLGPGHPARQHPRAGQPVDEHDRGRPLRCCLLQRRVRGAARDRGAAAPLLGGGQVGPADGGRAALAARRIANRLRLGA